MFYTQDAVEYSICSAAEFEAAHWERIEKYVRKQFPEAQRIGDVGFAIDRYIENKVDEGVFVCGILYKNISTEHLTTDLIGEIGWRALFSQRYAIFNHKGDYARLSDTYYSAIGTLLQKKVQIDKSTLIMEQYLNSPADTPSEELMTEIWVPIEDSFRIRGL